MRKAIIVELLEITEFGNRVREAFTAPTNYTTPYCTVKMTGENPVSYNKKASPLNFEVYIYANPASFTLLDSLEMKVRKKLHLQTLLTDDSPAKIFRPEYIQTLADWFDDQRNLFMKTLYFNIPLSRT